MLRSVKSLEGFAIGATDGPFGKVRDFYFDDQSWVIRYLVVDTSAWLGGRKVLISPYAIGTTGWDAEVLPATITKQQIKDSPGIDADEPVSRQYEKSYLGYYGYPYYWGGTGLWGDSYYPGTVLPGAQTQYDDAYRGHLRGPSADDGDPHLRSCNQVKGYHLSATDGEIGHVEGFLIDDATWSIRRIGISNARPVQGCPPPLLRIRPYVASKLRSRVAGLENLAASRLLRRALGRCRATKPASRAARMAPTPAFTAA